MSKTEEPPVEELLALLQSLQGKLKVLREAYLQQSAELNSLREKQDSQQKLVDELQEENEELNANLKRLRALQYKEAEESGAAGGGLHPRPTSGASLEPPILGFLEEVASTPDMQVQLLKQQLISLNADRVDLQRRLRQVAMQKVQREQVLQDKLSFRARQRELEAEYQSLPVALPGFFSLRSYKHTYLCCAVALGIQTMTANRNRAGSWEKFTATPRGRNKFALITHTKRYVTVKKGGSIHVGSPYDGEAADKSDDKERHIFEFVKGRFEDGRPFRIKTFLGSYLACDSKGHLSCVDQPGVETTWFVEERQP